MAIGVIAALLATLAWVAAHLAHMHLRPTRSRLSAMFRAFLASLPLVVLITLLILRQPHWHDALAGVEHPALAYGMGLLLEVLFFFCFVECFYHVERAVTLRMVIEIMDHPDGPPTLDDLVAAYPVDDMIRRRLQDLQRNGFLVRKGDGWNLTGKGRVFAAVMQVSNAIFNSKPQNERLP